MSEKDNFALSVIIPFFNEREVIPELVNELNSYFSKNKELRAEVVFVDDGSTDGSLELLEGQNHIFYSAKLIRLSRNFGSHAALRAGILNSSAGVVTYISADLQEPLELIKELYEKYKEGNDIVLAYRSAVNVGIMEKLFSRLYALLMRRFVFPAFPKRNFDIVMFNKKVKDELNQNIEANSSIVLQIFSFGFKQAWVAYEKKRRLAGRSKWTLPKKVKLLIDSFVAFSYVPIRFVTIMGFLMSVIGFLWVLYLVHRKIFYNDIVTGWPALMAILIAGFGITNISLGIIAEYMWRTLDASRNRKVFIIDKITELERGNESYQN